MIYVTETKFRNIKVIKYGQICSCVFKYSKLKAIDALSCNIQNKTSNTYCFGYNILFDTA